MILGLVLGVVLLAVALVAWARRSSPGSSPLTDVERFAAARQLTSGWSGDRSADQLDARES